MRATGDNSGELRENSGGVGKEKGVRVTGCQLTGCQPVTGC